jgi:hypothetical protein
MDRLRRFAEKRVREGHHSYCSFRQSGEDCDCYFRFGEHGLSRALLATESRLEAAERENERRGEIEGAAREVRDCFSRGMETTGTRRYRALLRLDYAITLADNQRAALTPALPASEDLPESCPSGS